MSRISEKTKKMITGQDAELYLAVDWIETNIFEEHYTASYKLGDFIIIVRPDYYSHVSVHIWTKKIVLDLYRESKEIEKLDIDENEKRYEKLMEKISESETNFDDWNIEWKKEQK